ncbi:MAG: hypothetical protein HYX78_02800 [Armatimonadetes bacterium]|nr:hypothetical protein [Armatimonadota bacterium]
MLQLKIIRTIFQDCESRHDPSVVQPKFVLVLDMEDKNHITSADIPNIREKMEMALPGIFPDEDSPLVHSCGGRGTDIEKHSFYEEIEQGTNIPHLLEHVIIHLMSRRSNQCSAYCGQRSVDLENGVSTHYYLVMDYPSKLEAVIAADLAFQLVSAWTEGRTVTIDPVTVLEGIRGIIEPMVSRAA